MSIKKILQPKLILTVLFSLSFSIYYYFDNYERAVEIQKSKLFIAATGIKYTLTNGYLEKAINGTATNEEFEVLNEKLSRYAKDLEVEYVYAFIYREQKFKFIVNSTTVVDYQVNLENDVYKEYTPTNNSLRESLETKKVIYTRVDDKWGSFNSIVLPFELESGEVILFGVDIKVTELVKQKSQILINTILLFILLCLLLFSSIKLVLFLFKFKKFPYKGLSIFEHIVVIFFATILTAVLSFYFYKYKEELYFSKIDSKIYSTAIAMDFILPQDFHDKVETMSKEEHQKNIDPLTKYAIEVGVEYLYTMVEKDGMFFYSISSTNPKDLEKGTLTEFMEPWPQIENEVREAFYTGQILYRIETGLRWGDFRNIFIPIKKEFGRGYALGSDYPLKDVYGFKFGNLIQTGFVSVLIFFPVLSLVYEIVYAILQSISNLKKTRFVSLKLKMTFFISTVILLSIGILSYIFFVNGKKIIQDKTLEMCKSLASNIGTIAREDLLLDSTYESTNKALSEFGKNSIENIHTVYLINAYGKYVADLTKTKKGQYAPESEIQYIQTLSDIEMKEEYSIKSRKQYLRFTSPVFIEYKGKTIRIGATIFEYDKEKLYEPVYEVQKIIFYTGVILLILVILVTYLLSNYVTKPLLYLTEGTKIIAKGDLDYVLNISSNDEVGILSKRFNEMTLNLRKSYDELEVKVNQRTFELSKTQATLTSVLETAPIILFATDSTGLITLCEGKALSHIGIQRGQAVGISFFELFEDKLEALEAARTALSGKNLIVVEHLEKNTFEVNFNTLYDSENNIVGFVSTYFDITENIKSQEAIREERDKSEKLLLNILPSKIASELKLNGSVKPILYKSVTVIFTDFKGFTKIASHMSPEELLNKLDMIFLQFDQICERRKIEKLKTIGDAYMCAGGLPDINNSHPIDACLAALEMQNFMNETKEIIEQISGEKFWDMRLGIHTGEVIAGIIGKTKFAYDVWGDAVNTASRMESNGDIGKINISDTTFEIVKDYFECDYRGKIEAKNKGMIDMYFLKRLKPNFSRDERGIAPNEKFMEIYTSKFFPIDN